MKIYTRAGDRGETGLFGGQRVRKDHARVEAYGTIDELNSALGIAKSHLQQTNSTLTFLIERVQLDLFDIGSELATPQERLASPLGQRIRLVGDEAVTALETNIDALDNQLPPLKTFILPAGSLPSSALHLARAVCRRAERRTVTLSEETEVRPLVLTYLNRLSDFLFVLARYANHELHVEDVLWKS